LQESILDETEKGGDMFGNLDSNSSLELQDKIEIINEKISESMIVVGKLKLFN